MTRIVLVLCLVALVLPRTAFAGDPVAAAALFQAGRDASKRGDWVVACDKFAESQRLDAAPGTLFNLALCEEKLSRVASAWQHYRQVADQLPASDERVALSRARVGSLEPRLPRLTLRLRPGGSAVARVARNSVVMGPAALGTPVPIDPGEHVITVTAEGHEPARYTISVREGEHRDLEVGPGPVVESPAPAQASRSPIATTPKPAAPPPAAAATLPSSGLRTAGFVGIGVGVVGLGVSGVTGALALSEKHRMEDHCDARAACDRAGVDAAERGATLATVSTAALAVGAVGVGVGLYLVVTSSAGGEERVAVGAEPARRGTALLVRGRF